MNVEIFLSLLGFGVGIFSGLLGVGGGILMVPALAFLPEFWGIAPYSVHLATGISAVQGLVGGMSSVVTHYRKGSVVVALLGPLILGSFMGGFLGGVVSAFLPALSLFVIFALVLMTTLGCAILLPVAKEAADKSNTSSQGLRFGEGVIVGGVISFLSANIGIGGSILLLPVLIYVKKVPTRLAIGTGAGFIIVTALSAVIGKMIMHLIPFPDVLWASLGAIFGGALGARLSHRLPATFLRRLLFFLVSLTLFRVLYEIYRLIHQPA